MYTPLRNLKPSREWVSFWNIFIRFRVVRGECGEWRAAQRSPAQILRHSSALDSDRRTRRTAARYHQLSVRIRPRSGFSSRTGSVRRPIIRLSWFLPESSLRVLIDGPTEGSQVAAAISDCQKALAILGCPTIAYRLGCPRRAGQDKCGGPAWEDLKNACKVRTNIYSGGVIFNPAHQIWCTIRSYNFWDLRNTNSAWRSKSN